MASSKEWGDAWLAQSAEHATADLRVVCSSPRLVIELTLKNIDIDIDTDIDIYIYCDFCLAVSLRSLTPGEAIYYVKKTLGHLLCQAALRRGTCGEKLRPPANSHVSEPSQKQTLHLPIGPSDG